MFSRENSKLQMIETAHVNERKHASTNQHPVGDDVSTLHPLRSSAGFMPSDATASRTGVLGTRQVRFRDGTIEHYAQATKSAANQRPENMGRAGACKLAHVSGSQQGRASPIAPPQPELQYRGYARLPVRLKSQCPCLRHQKPLPGSLPSHVSKSRPGASGEGAL